MSEEAYTLTFEMPEPEGSAFKQELDRCSIPYEITDVRSHLGGIIETVSFAISLAANVVTILGAFVKTHPTAKPRLVIVKTPTENHIIDLNDPTSDMVANLDQYLRSSQVISPDTTPPTEQLKDATDNPKPSS